MRQYINLIESFVISEATQQTVVVYHGSNHEIDQFRFDNLRHRTGTPGTLSFTESLLTARIYGEYIYRAEVSGNFGDYENEDDVQKLFEIRHREKEVHFRKMAKAGYDFDFSNEAIEKRAEKLKNRIISGYYALWENCQIWEELGWDGAWCFESESRNLIVGRRATIKIIGKILPEQPDDNW